jgi:hypothetical protein
MADEIPARSVGAERPTAERGEDWLTRKVGPLPTWGWIVAAAIGVSIFLVIRSRGKQATAQAAQGTAATIPFGSTTPSEVGSSPVDVGLGQGNDLLSGGGSLAQLLQGIQGQLSSLQSALGTAKPAQPSPQPVVGPPPSTPPPAQPAPPQPSAQELTAVQNFVNQMPGASADYLNAILTSEVATYGTEFASLVPNYPGKRSF